MNPSQWSRLRDLFEDGLELPEGERQAFIDREAADDPEIRAELAQLLAAHSEATGFFASEDPALAHGSVGPYRLLEVLGEGGFGVVYLAEQTHPIRRRLALKLIKPGMDTKQVIARFDLERQSLALMDHPAIAQVFDAGATETGRPYFAMEYVAGVPITEFCDRQRLDLRQRLELFLQVCDAVQHAHQKGVIHRDIKPSNVLVSMRDGVPSPKVIDFGVGKATTEAADVGSLMTREGTIVGTLGYMSPEQATAGAVDTRSDIYSLGVVLYELLAGSPPFDPDRLRKAPLSDAVKVIREEEPPPLAARLDRTGEEEVAGIAERRASEPRRLRRELKGELQWITLRALEKDPERRYASAAELAADVRRHLAYEPVLAGAPSTAYRLRKLSRRHRAAVTAGAVVLVAVLGGGIAAGVGFRRAVLSERDARKDAASARQVAQFLGDLFDSSTPDRSLGETITARRLLDDAARRIRESSLDDPDVRASVLSALGNAHLKLGLYDEGVGLLREAQATSESARPRDEKRVVQQMVALANGMKLIGKADSSEILLDAAMARLRGAGSGTSDVVAECLSQKGSLLYTKGEFAAADSLLSSAVRMEEGRKDPDKSLLLGAYVIRASIAHRQFKLDDAEGYYLRSLQLAEEVGRPTAVVSARRGLCWLYSQKGEPEKAQEHADEAVRLARRIYAPDHPDLAMALSGQAAVLSGRGDVEQAIAVREEALGILRATGLQQDFLAHELNSVGLCYRHLGKFDLAAARYEEACAIRRKAYGADNVRTAESVANLARCYADAGFAARADSTYRLAIPVFEKNDPKSLFAAYAYMGYANVLRDAGHLARADSMYMRAQSSLDSTSAMRVYVAECTTDYGLLRSFQGRHAEAESMLAVGFRLGEQVAGEDDASLAGVHVRWAVARARAGNPEGAMDELRRAAKCGAGAETAERFPELAALRSRPDYPLSSP